MQELREQDEKLRRFSETRDNLFSQGSYMKLANDLRKFYLRREMECSKTRCLTVDKLMDINDKFGSATDLQLSLDVNPRQIHNRMVQVLSDPFSCKNSKCRSTFTSLRDDNKLFANGDLYTPGNARSEPNN